jgi:hypothetical protein
VEEEEKNVKSIFDANGNCAKNSWDLKKERKKEKTFMRVYGRHTHIFHSLNDSGEMFHIIPFYVTNKLNHFTSRKAEREKRDGRQRKTLIFDDPLYECL